MLTAVPALVTANDGRLRSVWNDIDAEGVCRYFIDGKTDAIYTDGTFLRNKSAVFGRVFHDESNRARV